MNKKCFKCNKTKKIDSFYKHPQMPDGHVNKCKDCNKIDVRENYSLKSKYYSEYDKKRIRYNFNYIFTQRYSGIKGRSTKKNKRSYDVFGKEFCTKEEFFKWCYEEKNYLHFYDLWIKWKKSNFDKKLSPSIDRINNNLGYQLNNIRWVSLSDNCKKYNK